MTRKLVHLDSELSAFDDSYSTCVAERAWCDNAKRAEPSTTACREILAKLSMRFNLTIVLPRLVLYTVYGAVMNITSQTRILQLVRLLRWTGFLTYRD